MSSKKLLKQIRKQQVRTKVQRKQAILDKNSYETQYENEQDLRDFYSLAEQHSIEKDMGGYSKFYK